MRVDVSDKIKAYDESNALYYQIKDIVKSQADGAMLKEIHEEIFDIYR